MQITFYTRLLKTTLELIYPVQRLGWHRHHYLTEYTELPGMKAWFLTISSNLCHSDMLYWNVDFQGVLRVRKRVTKMVVAVSVIYALCWIPDLVIYSMIHFSSEHNMGDTADIISIILVTCNSTVNPFIYAYVSRPFRRRIKALLCYTCADRNRVHDMRNGFESTTGNRVTCAATVKRDAQVMSDSEINLPSLSTAF